MSILVVGSVALDTIKTPLGRVKEVLGGSAVYFSASAVNFAPVSLVAVVGKDFPEKHIDLMKRCGIDIDGLIQKPGKTFRWEGEYGWDFSDAKTIATYLNVFSQFEPKIPKDYINSKHIFLANIDPKIQERLLTQVKKPKLVACDTMNFWIEKKRKDLLRLIGKVDIFLLNESEARALTTETNLIKAGKEILKLGPKVVIIKKGEHGVLLFTEKTIFVTPAFLLETVFDPTGAGDTFAGGFMGYLAKAKRYNQGVLKEAIIYGTIMATFAVEDFSLRKLATVTDKDIKNRLKEFKKFTVY